MDYIMSNNTPLHHTQSPQQSPTIPPSGGLMRHHLRVQHPGYSPHTTPHQSPNVVYTPTTTQQNVFQFPDNMHHQVMQDNTSGVVHSPNVPLHSPSVPLQSPMAMHSPNVPLHSPVPQSPSANTHHRYAQKPRFSFPPNLDQLQVKTEITETASPLTLPYQDVNQGSPASSTHSVHVQNTHSRYPQVGNTASNTEVMLSAIDQYTENEMLREGGFDVPSTQARLINENLIANMPGQQTSSLPDPAPSDFDIFEAEASMTESYLDQNLQQQMQESYPETTNSYNLPAADIARTTVATTTAASVPMTTSMEQSTAAPKVGVAVSGGKTRGAGRGGRGGRTPGHRPNLTCQICGKRFNNSSAIAKHKLTHSDERKYACTICAKAFKRQDHLNGHMLTHRDKKPYECKFENCDKSYSDARSLRRHLENHHSIIEGSQGYGQGRMGQFGSNYSSSQSGGQYFQFDRGMAQQGYDPATTESSGWRQFRSGDRSPGYMQQVSPISPATGANHPTSPHQTQPPQRAPWSMFDDGPKTVECSLCHRRFKNIPALNGHMRLHGGYFKKDNEDPVKGDEQKPAPANSVKKENEGQMLPPLQTTFSQKQSLSDSTFQKPAAPQSQSQQSFSLQNQPTDLSRKGYDVVEDVRRLQERRDKGRDILAGNLPSSAAEALRMGLDPQHQYLNPQSQLLQSVLVSSNADLQHQLDAPVAAALTLADMSAISQGSRDIGQHDISILERRLLAYTGDGSFPQLKFPDRRFADMSMEDREHDSDRQLSIKSPTSGTLFSFPERPPSQTLNVPISDSSERKRHLSADADKFTSPKRLSDYSTEYSKPNPYSKTLEDNMFPKPRQPDAVQPKPHDPLSRSLPTSMFRNPGDPSSQVLVRRPRKPRPEPLFIPPHVNHFGFHSRLRSPRLWDKGVACTPPPYTPPPMLSPVRKGCGLFWSIQPYRPVTPKSAPITPKLIPPVRLPSVHEDEFPEEVPAEPEEEEPPPATDIKPHVNVGEQYQAEVPDWGEEQYALLDDQELGDLVWCPDSQGDNTLDEVQCYMDFACCAAVPGSGTNKEYAIHLLHYSKGDIQKALTLLMLDTPQFPRSHVLSTYKYDETDHWSAEEIDAFHNALVKCDKDFYSIAREILKSTKQCIEFYYLWKKVCPDEYKRLRILRRKKEQEEMHNLRSKVADDVMQESKPDIDRYPEPEPETFVCDYPECDAVFASRQALSGHARVHAVVNKALDLKEESIPSPCSDYSFTGEEFPCRVCGKVFGKVKSRNAHMKSHRAVDHGGKPAYIEAP